MLQRRTNEIFHLDIVNRIFNGCTDTSSLKAGQVVSKSACTTLLEPPSAANWLYDAWYFRERQQPETSQRKSQHMNLRQEKSKPVICNLSYPKFTNQCLSVVCIRFKFHFSTDVYRTALRQTSASWQGHGFSNRLTEVREILAAGRLKVAAPQTKNWPQIR